MVTPLGQGSCHESGQAIRSSPQAQYQAIRENQTVVLEDLNVSGMVKNRKMAHAIAGAGWRMFRILLESKAKMYGRVVEVFNRWHPSSQICSKCGHQSGKKTLSIRHWQYPNCEAVHDRDINAARNYSRSRRRACGDSKRLSEPVSPACWFLALMQEPT